MHTRYLQFFLVTAFLLFVLLLSRADVEGLRFLKERFESMAEGMGIKCPAFNPVEPRGASIADKPKPPPIGLSEEES